VLNVNLKYSNSQADEWFEDYECFLSLFGVKGGANSVSSVGRRGGVLLYFAWVQGENRYLQI